VLWLFLVKLEVGHLLSKTLRLVRKIGDGGMASVWLAEHLVLGTQVAVKVISGPFADVPGAQSRFVREARMTARIDSPHVVRVLDCRLTEGDEPYLVLELLRGENLEERVRRHGPLSLSDTIEVVSQACEALAASHRAGIVHRDLKPENIFLVSGPTLFVKLLDFGIAKPIDRADCLECDRIAAGTPQYMGPEHIFEPERTDERSDLFSLAAVAYFALTRRTPFDADSLHALYIAIDSGFIRPPSELRPELPVSLDHWFARALAFDPMDRFPDPRSMTDALYDAARDARSGRPTLPPPLPIDIDLLSGREAPLPPPQPLPRVYDQDARTYAAMPIFPTREIRLPRRVAMAAIAFAAGASLLSLRERAPELPPQVTAFLVDHRDDGAAEGALDLRANLSPRVLARPLEALPEVEAHLAAPAVAPAPVPTATPAAATEACIDPPEPAIR